MLEAGLNSWYQGTLDLGQADAALCTNMAKGIHALRTANPSRHFLLRLRRPVVEPLLTRDTLIWQPRAEDAHLAPARSICLLNLSSWSFRELHGDEREQVFSVVASEEMVAMMTYSNTCYAWELHGTKSHKFRLPSMDYLYSATCRERSVACAALTHDQIAVFIWQFDTRQGQSFQISRYVENLCLGIPRPRSLDRQRPLWLLLQPKTSSIIVVASTQYATRGATDKSEAATLPDRYGSIRLYGINQLIPISHQGRFMLNAMCTFSGTGALREELVRLELDEHANRFIATGGRPWSPSRWNWWNDTFCHGDLRPTCTGTLQGLLTTTIGNTSGFSRTLVTLGRLDDRLDAPVRRETLINDKYIVHNLHTGLAVFCFDQGNDCLEQHGRVFGEGEVVSLDFEPEPTCKESG